MISAILPRGALHVVDALSITTLVATIASALPTIAALLTIIWTLLRIYETETVQRLVARFRQRTPD